MSQIPSPHKVYILIICLSGFVLIGRLVSVEPVAVSDLREKQGRVTEAECVVTSSVNGLKFLAAYDDVPVEDYVNLPGGSACEDLLPILQGNTITITYFDNKYFGITVGDRVLISSETAVDEFNDKSGSVSFVAFLTLVAALSFYLRGWHVTRRTSARPVAAGRP